jgi:hypothetical protein
MTMPFLAIKNKRADWRRRFSSSSFDQYTPAENLKKLSRACHPFGFAPLVARLVATASPVLHYRTGNTVSALAEAAAVSSFSSLRIFCSASGPWNEIVVR